MAALFLKLLNMSISSSWLVLAVLLLRLLLNKAPKWINGILWGIVGLRLIMPFSFESVLSLIPSTQTISKAPDAPRPHIESGVAAFDNQVNDYLHGHYFEGVTKPAGYFADITTILAVLWLIGVVVFLAYAIISYLRLSKKVGTAVLLYENIFQSERVGSPFVLGIVRPKIYLPFSVNEQNIFYVIAHEKAHISRKDHLWKPIGFLIFAIHWFNPLMWLGYILLCRDIELACDEKVIKEFDKSKRADYSQALLNSSINRRNISACPLAFGEVSVKKRIKTVIKYKKPAFWIVVAAIIISFAVAVCFLTDPPQRNTADIIEQKSDSTLDGISLSIVSAEFLGEEPSISVKLENNSGKEIIFGEEFHLYYVQGTERIDCNVNEDVLWALVGYNVTPGKAAKHTYSLNEQNIECTGEYRFSVPFNCEGKKYKAWVDFKIENIIEEEVSLVLCPERLVFIGGLSSYTQTASAAPDYVITKDMLLYIAGESYTKKIKGRFEKIKLNEENFDLRFASYPIWSYEETVEILKSNNKYAWQLITEDNDLFLLLKQKDGTYYIGEGELNPKAENAQNSDKSYIRWLYKIKNGDITIEKVPLNFPPEMAVSSENIATIAQVETYYWNYKNDKGEWEYTEKRNAADKPSINGMPYIDLLPLGSLDGEEQEVTIQLNAMYNQKLYKLSPDFVYVSCYSAKDWGKVNAKFERIEFYRKDSGIYFPLKNGDYVYEIQVNFEAYEQFGGGVEYCFYTLKAE